MPWVDSETLGPNRPGFYAYGLLVFGIPNLVVTGAAVTGSRPAAATAGVGAMFYEAQVAGVPDDVVAHTHVSVSDSTADGLINEVQRLEARGLLERVPCPGDRRATNARLTEAGLRKVRESAPGHAATVRDTVIDALSAEQVDQLAAICDAVLHRLDPDGRRAAIYERYDSPAPPHRDA